MNQSMHGVFTIIITIAVVIYFLAFLAYGENTDQSHKAMNKTISLTGITDISSKVLNMR